MDEGLNFYATWTNSFCQYSWMQLNRIIYIYLLSSKLLVSNILCFWQYKIGNATLNTLSAIFVSISFGQCFIFRSNFFGKCVFRKLTAKNIPKIRLLYRSRQKHVCCIRKKTAAGWTSNAIKLLLQSNC